MNNRANTDENFFRSMPLDFLPIDCCDEVNVLWSRSDAGNLGCTFWCPLRHHFFNNAFISFIWNLAV